MQIIWHGQSCFEIITAKGKGESVVILVDPPSEVKTGLKAPKIGAQIVLLTNSAYTVERGDLDKIAPGAFVIDSPGEYEVKGIYIRGTDINFGRNNLDKNAAMGVIYTIETEDMKVCHMGNYADEELAIAQVEKIGNIDILIAPIGDGAKFGAKEALKIVSQIEPSIIIPMNYQIPKLKIDAGDLQEFLKAAGVGQTEAQPKLTIKKKEIPVEEAKIIVLNP